MSNRRLLSIECIYRQKHNQLGSNKEEKKKKGGVCKSVVVEVMVLCNVMDVTDGLVSGAGPCRMVWVKASLGRWVDASLAQPYDRCDGWHRTSSNGPLPLSFSLVGYVLCKGMTHLQLCLRQTTQVMCQVVLKASCHIRSCCISSRKVMITAALQVEAKIEDQALYVGWCIHTR